MFYHLYCTFFGMRGQESYFQHWGRVSNFNLLILLFTYGLIKHLLILPISEHFIQAVLQKNISIFPKVRHGEKRIALVCDIQSNSTAFSELPGLVYAVIKQYKHNILAHIYTKHKYMSSLPLLCVIQKNGHAKRGGLFQFWSVSVIAKFPSQSKYSIVYGRGISSKCCKVAVS